MDAMGVLLTCPMSDYLEAELEKRFKLFKLWNYSSMADFSRTPESDSVRAVVGDTTIGADAETIESLPRLSLVATYSVGLDKIDLGKCAERGIRVANTPDVLTDDVADLAIGLILGVMRRICASDEFLRRGFWKKNHDFRLTTRFSGKSVGIVGLGRIGSAIAKRARSFGCEISYFSRSEKPNLTAYKYYSNLTELATDTVETSEAMADLVVRNLEAFSLNKPLLTPVV